MHNLAIPQACPIPWGALTPTDAGRHCSVCNKTVLNLVGLDKLATDKALAEIRDKLVRGEEVCARISTGGTRPPVQTRPSPGPGRFRLTNGLAAMLAMTIAGSQSHHFGADWDRTPIIMGRMCVTETHRIHDATRAIMVEASGTVMTARKNTEVIWSATTPALIQKLHLDHDAVLITTPMGQQRRHLITGLVIDPTKP